MWKMKNKESPKVATIEEETIEENRNNSDESVKEYAQDREEIGDDSLGHACDEMLLFEMIDVAKQR